MKWIDLAKTIDSSQFLRQSDVAKELFISSQQMYGYYHDNKMTKGQNMAFILWFEKKHIPIFYKKK